jgi:putative ABC transport system permease protein
MRNALRELRADPRQHVPSALVVTVAALFGVVIIDGVAILSAWMHQSELVQESGTALAMLVIVGVVFFAIALFVSAMVIANTFGIIVAGRSERIALLRLIGASARRLRRSVGAEGLLVGTGGAVLGAALGTAAALTGIWLMDRLDVASGLTVDLFGPALAAPVLTTVLVTWGAAHAGARRVLTVSPMEATGQAREPNLDEARSSRARHLLSATAAVVGTVLLLAGVVLGQRSPMGILVALPGGILSFTGLALGSAWVMPPVQHLVGRLLGRRPAGRLAARNAARYPMRTARTTMGLVIGVTLIVMFATAAANLDRAMGLALQADESLTADDAAQVSGLVADALTFFSVLLAFSVLIAVIGVVNNMSLAVLQRTREIGLLRAVGLSRRRVRAMILAESAQVTAAATVVGVVLGVLYGWAGTMSLLSALDGVGLFAPAVPWGVLGGAVVAAGLVVAVASVAPARRAVRISPTTALQAV